MTGNSDELRYNSCYGVKLFDFCTLLLYCQTQGTTDAKFNNRNDRTSGKETVTLQSDNDWLITNRDKSVSGLFTTEIKKILSPSTLRLNFISSQG